MYTERGKKCSGRGECISSLSECGFHDPSVSGKPEKEGIQVENISVNGSFGNENTIEIFIRINK